MEKIKLAESLKKYKYPLLVLLVGLGLMLLPSFEKPVEAPASDERLRDTLAAVEGVGESKVLISDNGVVVVCAGAENAKVRLEILYAVRSYTGFGSDKITILKLAD